METIIAALAGLIGIGLGYMARMVIGRLGIQESEARAKQALDDAVRESKTLRREAELQIKSERLKAREEFEAATETRRRELAQLEERLTQREVNVDRKAALLDKKDAACEARLQEVEARDAALRRQQGELEAIIAEERAKLQRAAGMTGDEARKALMLRVERDVQGEMSSLIRRKQEEARETAEREATKIVTLAIQRYAGSHASETMTSSVALPSEDMKGRVIGREGRNIRALEACTGVNVLIDDTPEAVVITSFDPIRREIARQALEVLVADGRIHPARIEEVVAKVQQSMEETIRNAGAEAAYELGIQNLDPELLRRLGRLKYRTSYSQNVLRHSVEVARLMAMMASELRLDVDVAKRVGLFHDIGKALDHEVEGGHALIGADLLKRCGESLDVVNGVAAHHNDVEAVNVFAALAAAADAISSSRPGARSETTEIYIKRLEKLEAIANSHPGVIKCYAIQAGREVRVFVDPGRVGEGEALQMARHISKQIEDELQYPGQIRIVVIRETRCVEYAR
ncbi:MAG: ribonuclease Y [Lentisphaerae bacterium]|nr:ribonuclease Y [Lentisphaerota bacterium]